MGNYYSFTIAGLLIGALLFTCLWVVGIRKGIYNLPRNQAPLYWSAKLWSPALSFIVITKLFIADFMLVPTSSMWPAIEPGSFVFSSKTQYNVWFLPFSSSRIFELSDPKAGDVVQFINPVDGKTKYIKRVIATPGQSIIYTKEKNIIIKTKDSSTTLAQVEHIDYVFDKIARKMYKQTLTNNKKVEIALIPHYPSFIDSNIPPTRYGAWASNCQFNSLTHELACSLGADEYFLMGDNRDQSLDSRYIGVVKKSMIIDKAVLSCAIKKNSLAWLPRISCTRI